MTTIPFPSLRVMMLKRICKYCTHRNFSRSSLWRNELQKQPPENQRNDGAAIQIDAVPKQWEKRVLVLTGKFKSIEDVPPRVSYDTIGKAKSIMRVRVANVMMVGILCLCFFFSYRAKQMAKGGDSIMKRVLEDSDRAVAELRAKDAAAAKAKAELEATSKGH